MRLASLALVAIGTLLVACPPPAEDQVPSRPDAGADAGSPHAELAARFVDVLCVHLQRCANPEAFASGRDFCLEKGLDQGFFGPPGGPLALQDAVLAGRIVVDDSKVPACLEAVRALECDHELFGEGIVHGLRGIPACEAAFTGTVPENGHCTVAESCAPGLRCLFDDTWCDGICVNDQTGRCEGQRGECGPGRECALVSGPIPRCVAPGGEGAACRSDAACRPGLYCADLTAELPGTCETAGTEGAKCDGADRCVAGLVCTPDGASTKCVKAAPSVACASEATCGGDLACAWDFSNDVLACRPAGAVSQPCREDGTCAAGLACRGGTCVDPAAPLPTALHSPCDPHLGCGLDSLVCARVLQSWACLARASENDACEADEQCSILDGLFCDPSTKACVRLPSVGAPCLDGTRCNPLDSWCDTSSETPVCTAFLADGAACDSSLNQCGFSIGPGAGRECVDGHCGRRIPDRCTP